MGGTIPRQVGLGCMRKLAELSILVHPFTPRPEEAEEVDLCEFKAIFVYILSYRLIRKKRGGDRTQASE